MLMKMIFFSFTANRESAFFHSISSAGVVHEVTRSCSRGELKDECSCDRSKHGEYDDGFIWDRCNDNIKFGTEFSRAFLDAREVVNDARALLNKHNNEAGRQVSNLRVYSKLIRRRGLVLDVAVITTIDMTQQVK